MQVSSSDHQKDIDLTSSLLFVPKSKSGPNGNRDLSSSPMKATSEVGTDAGKDLPLKDMIIYAEIYSNETNISEASYGYLENLGAKIEKRFNKKCSLVIWKDGSIKTVEKAREYGIPIVNSLWIEDCVENFHCADFTKYAPSLPKEADLPFLSAHERKKRKAEPLNLDEEARMDESMLSSLMKPVLKKKKKNSEDEAYMEEKVSLRFESKHKSIDDFEKKKKDGKLLRRSFTSQPAVGSWLLNINDKDKKSSKDKDEESDDNKYRRNFTSCMDDGDGENAPNEQNSQIESMFNKQKEEQQSAKVKSMILSYVKTSSFDAQEDNGNTSKDIIGNDSQHDSENDDKLHLPSISKGRSSDDSDKEEEKSGRWELSDGSNDGRFSSTKKKNKPSFMSRSLSLREKIDSPLYKEEPQYSFKTRVILREEQESFERERRSETKLIADKRMNSFDIGVTAREELIKAQKTGFSGLSALLSKYTGKSDIKVPQTPEKPKEQSPVRKDIEEKKPSVNKLDIKSNKRNSGDSGSQKEKKEQKEQREQKELKEQKEQKEKTKKENQVKEQKKEEEKVPPVRRMSTRIKKDESVLSKLNKIVESMEEERSESESEENKKEIKKKEEKIPKEAEKAKPVITRQNTGSEKGSKKTPEITKNVSNEKEEKKTPKVERKVSEKSSEDEYQPKSSKDKKVESPKKETAKPKTTKLETPVKESLGTAAFKSSFDIGKYLKTDSALGSSALKTPQTKDSSLTKSSIVSRYMDSESSNISVKNRIFGDSPSPFSEKISVSKFNEEEKEKPSRLSKALDSDEEDVKVKRKERTEIKEDKGKKEEEMLKKTIKKKADVKKEDCVFFCGFTGPNLGKAKDFCEKFGFKLLEDELRNLYRAEMMVYDGRELPKNYRAAYMMSLGKPIINKNWIEESVKTGKLQGMKQYEQTYDSGVRKTLLDGLRFSIDNKEFENLTGNVVQKKDLVALIEQAGGKVVENVRASDFCIMKKTGKGKGDVPPHVKVITSQWIIDSLLEGRRLNTEDVNYTF